MTSSWELGRGTPSKIQSSAHLHVDGKSCSRQNISGALKRNAKNIHALGDSEHLNIPSVQKPRDAKLSWKHVIYTIFQEELFTVAAKLKALACIPSEVGSQAQQHVDGVNGIMSNKFGILELLDNAGQAVRSRLMFF